jgi:retinol dehydrogenase-12
MEWYSYLLIILIIYIFRRYFNNPFTKHRRSMKGKIIIITGASAGIGKESALQLLEDGADVIFATRDKNKTYEIINALKDNKVKAHWIHLDLNSLKSVEKFVDDFKSKFEHVDILINNAGFFPTEFTLTEDNIESCFQINHLSHMYLTYLLLDYFTKTEGRIINVSSRLHKACDFTDESIKQLYEDKDFTSFKKYYNSLIGKRILYGNTKMANIYFASYLAEICEARYPYIKVFSLHPGVIASDFFNFLNEYGFKFLLRLIFDLVLWFFSKSPKAGAQTQLDLCYRDFGEVENGGYFDDCKLGKVTNLAKDKKIKDLFIDYSCNLIRNTGRNFEL